VIERTKLYRFRKIQNRHNYGENKKFIEEMEENRKISNKGNWHSWRDWTTTNLRNLVFVRKLRYSIKNGIVTQRTTVQSAQKGHLTVHGR